MKHPAFSTTILAYVTGFAALLIAVVVWPRIDLAVSGWFYEPGKGFYLADQPVFVFLHEIASRGSWILGGILALIAVFSFTGHKSPCGISAKGWLFLFLGLVIAPGLIANVGFKDHWGRARPREVMDFGGNSNFSPALIPHENARSNGSFVAGDGAFGFWLPSFAYVVPRSRSRRVFWGGIDAGIIFGAVRIVMGAHFLSDVLFAALFMLAATAGLHAAMFGSSETKRCWREWMLRGTP